MRARGDEWEMEHYQALRAVCPRCRAAPGEWCTNPITRAPLDGPPAHFQRIEAGQQLPAD